MIVSAEDLNVLPGNHLSGALYGVEWSGALNITNSILARRWAGCWINLPLSLILSTHHVRNVSLVGCQSKVTNTAIPSCKTPLKLPFIRSSVGLHLQILRNSLTVLQSPLTYPTIYRQADSLSFCIGFTQHIKGVTHTHTHSREHMIAEVW